MLLCHRLQQANHAAVPVDKDKQSWPKASQNASKQEVCKHLIQHYRWAADQAGSMVGSIAQSLARLNKLLSAHTYRVQCTDECNATGHELNPHVTYELYTSTSLAIRYCINTVWHTTSCYMFWLTCMQSVQYSAFCTVLKDT